MTSKKQKTVFIVAAVALAVLVLLAVMATRKAPEKKIGMPMTTTVNPPPGMTYQNILV